MILIVKQWGIERYLFCINPTMHILIVEDEFMLRKSLGFKMMEGGHTVSMVANGMEAIQLIEKNKNIDLIICDIMMPVLSGAGFLLLLKKHFPKKLPAIIILTSMINGEAFIKKLNLKYDYFMSKPPDYSKLTAVIEDVLSPLPLQSGHPA
jgi:DNA-binding response OmpR family regulator